MLACFALTTRQFLRMLYSMLVDGTRSRFGLDRSVVNSLVATVADHARLRADQPAILFEDQVIAYGQLGADVDRFAQALVAWGLQSGDRVALFLENCPAFAVAYLGVQRARGIVVLVNTQ